ncbi:MAG TPA: uracil-DNA glycosylase [Balneolaceae bacterium]|nr:uracil-DNA glycosylase [Balneolaceae bacterium]
MPDPKELIEKAERFLKQQQNMYGDFSVNFSKQQPLAEPQSSEKAQDTEVDQVQEPSESYEETAAKEQESVQPETKEEPELSTEQKIAACSTLEELHDLCKNADELRTDLDDTNLVFGVGDSQADLMVIGEAPGYNEDQQGEPFVGDAGQLLDKIMDAIGFQRNDIYIANILKHRPPNNRDPKPEEAAASLPYLLRQIELIDPKLILSVGKVSGNTLLETDTTLSDLRNQFHSFHGRELMVTYHPAALVYNQKYKRPTWEDVQKLRKRYDELGGK